jgi:hypothetical protein
MQHEKTNAGHPQDQDIDFDMNESSTTATPMGHEDEPGDFVREEAPSDFPPLTDQEKQPKMQDDERIKEMNRRTAIDD